MKRYILNIRIPLFITGNKHRSAPSEVEYDPDETNIAARIALSLPDGFET